LSGGPHKIYYEPPLSHLPEIIFGAGRLADLASKVENLAGKGAAVLVVADPMLTTLGITERALKILGDAGFEAQVFDGLKGEPKVADIDAAAGIARAMKAKHAYRLIVTRGGLTPAPLADTGRPDRRQIVAEPLIGNPDTRPAYPDDVCDIASVALRADARENNRAFFVDVARVTHISGRLAVANVRLMGFGACSKHMFAIYKHRDEDRMIRGMGIPEIWIIVKESVAFAQIRMQVTHGGCLQMHAENVHRESLGGRKKLIVRCADRT